MLCSTIPTEGRLRRSSWNPFAWVCGVLSCLFGAGVSLACVGSPIMKALEPTVRHWPGLLQVVVVFGIMLSTMAIGWIAVRFTICKIPWIDRNC